MQYTPTHVVDTVTTVATAVRERIIAEGGGDVNRFCPLVPGAIAWDECDCGQLAQTIPQVYPSDIFPAPASDTRTTPCGPQFIVVTVVLSLTRCVQGINDNGFAPTCAQLLDDALVLEADRYAVRKAILCALRELRDTYDIAEFSVGATTSVGPEGMCAGIEQAYAFALSNVCC